MNHQRVRNKRNLFYYSIFGVTIFLGAFLLFQVQPIIGKYILPWFGGTSFVWITSLLFFQTLLLAGYLYSFALNKLPLKTQVYLHFILVLITALAVTTLFFTWKSPITPGVEWKLPESVSPVIQVLVLLLLSIGLPYFLLSTTSTLLQKWLHTKSDNKSPYFLYSLSNIGSLLGIVSYPFLIEPLLSIHKQGIFWSSTFIIFCLFLSFCCLELFLHSKSIRNRNMPSKSFGETPKLHLKRKSLWFVLPAISSLMLLSATNQLTQSIVPIPFLWLLPLGLYLLSFILCFSEKEWYKPKLFAYGFFILFPFVIALLIQPIVIGLLFQLILYSLLLFFSFMLCHGELYNSKPNPQYLNIFYLQIAFGSVIGGSIVAIIAPLFFKGLFWEFYLALFLTSLVAAFALLQSNSGVFRFIRSSFSTNREMSIFTVILLCAVFGVFSFINYRVQALSAVGIWRNFYGTIRVTYEPTDKGRLLCLLNGKIIHGCQHTSSPLRYKPITYYGEKSGIALAIQSLRERNRQKGKKNLRIGDIGLGVGTLAAFGIKGDYFRFYELNPEDVTVANEYFTYLSDSPSQIDTVLGDGRLSLEKELQENKKGNFNLLVMDAFNDDAVPVHLLTKEAFALYLKHLSPTDNIIAVNISTTYIDLIPVVNELAKYYQMNVVVIDVKPKDEPRSIWALVSSDKKLLSNPTILGEKKNISRARKIPLWTDDYSNLFQLLRY